MIKKITAFVCLVFTWAISLQAQEAKTCFINMPDSLSPLLTSVNREDFIDFLDSKMKAEVTNNFGGKSEMTELASDYLFIKVTPQSSWQMKLLSLNDSTKVICAISTVCAPACDSHIKFYTTAWKELPALHYLPILPVMNDFMIEASDSTNVYEYQEALRQADLLLMKATLSSKDSTLVFTFSTSDYMDKKAAEKLQPFLRPSITYVWKEGKFILP